MEITFHILESPDPTERGQKIPVDLPGHSSITIGREHDVRLPLSGGGYISRRHLILEVNGPACYVYDLGSTNKTFVRRRNDPPDRWVESPPHQATRIYNGDYIRLGRRSESRTLIQLQFKLPATDTLVEELVYCVKCSQPAPADTTKGYDPFICRECRQHDAVQPEVARLPLDITHHYEPLAEVGRGGMGIVYRARRVTEGHPQVPPGAIVALKTITPEKALSQKDRDLFKRETEVCEALNHPHIVRFFERCDFHQGRLWFAMEYVEGDNAAQKSPFPLDDALRIADQILDALAYAHTAPIPSIINGRPEIQEGAVHRDIKPGNILITGQGRSLQAKLADFGLAKGFQFAGQSHFTSTTETRGALAYMSPDQIISYRDVTPAADIYSFGTTLYTLLTGHLPYNFGDDDDLFLHILDKPIVPLLERVPILSQPDSRWDAVAQVIEKAMQKQPEDRYASAAEMRAALAAISNQGVAR